MPRFVVNYRAVLNGSTTVEAESEYQARELIEEMNSSELGREADSIDLEITCVEKLPRDLEPLHMIPEKLESVDMNQVQELQNLLKK